jgi:hypothetical protein
MGARPRIKEHVLLSTTDYTLFEMHELNRLLGSNDSDYKPRPDLLVSMKANGFRSTQPIRCVYTSTGKLRIFDGHNRFIAAKYLGIPLWYIVFSEDESITPLDDVIGQRVWRTSDSARAYASVNPDYAEVLLFHEDTGLALNQCFSFFGNNSGDVGNCAGPIKTGGFKIKNRELPYKVWAMAKVIKEHHDFYGSSQLLRALSKITFAEGFDQDRMIQKLSARPEYIKKCRTSSDYITMFDEIYNANSKASNRFYLAAETDKAMRKRDLNKTRR